MKSNVTLAQFKKWARTNEGLAADVIAKRIVAKSERARVDAYIEPIFATFAFVDDEGKRVTHSDLLYTCEGQEEQMQAFYEATYDAHAAHGFTGERGKCPALCAENASIQAENALIESGCKLMAITSSLVYSGKHRTDMLALLLGACGFEQKAAA